MSNISVKDATLVWLNSPETKFKKFKSGIKSLYYNKSPQRYRFFGILHFSTKTLLTASAPSFAYYYGSIKDISVALFAGGLLTIWNVFISFFDSLSKEKVSSTSDDKLDVMVRFGDLLVAHRVGKTFQTTARDDAIRACLGILEIYARQITKTSKGDISVSVVLYRGNSKNNLQIRHRNPGNERPIGRDVVADGLIGHYVCEYGASPQVLHDLRELKVKRIASPTQSKVVYRSIFFYPLEVESLEGKTTKGFISIDCKKPYAFYGNRSDDIVVTCEPVLTQIRELIQEPQNVRKP